MVFSQLYTLEIDYWFCEPTLKFSISVSHASHTRYNVLVSCRLRGFIFALHLLQTDFPHLLQWCLLWVKLKSTSQISQAFSSWKPTEFGSNTSGRQSIWIISSMKCKTVSLTRQYRKCLQICDTHGQCTWDTCSPIAVIGRLHHAHVLGDLFLKLAWRTIATGSAI